MVISYNRAAPLGKKGLRILYMQSLFVQK